MYKIFFYEKQILLTNVEEKNKNIKYFLLNAIQMGHFLEKFLNSPLDVVGICHFQTENLLQEFAQKIELIQAAGGVVTNDKNQTLFIQRNGLWDLPKGKREKNESLEDCALREVQEETGIRNLSLKKYRSATYHIFKTDGKFFLKETHWFDMHSDFKGDFSPQSEEGIQAVAWRNSYQMNETLQKTYSNIKELFGKL